jgi:hypothetical protein
MNHFSVTEVKWEICFCPQNTLSFIAFAINSSYLLGIFKSRKLFSMPLSITSESSTNGRWNHLLQKIWNIHVDCYPELPRVYHSVSKNFWTHLYLSYSLDSLEYFEINYRHLLAELGFINSGSRTC